ncbi:hypothetical protein [Micromonospora ureilytica]|uniref:hypothetical protein n=1 Tax=Micromonospora ureilytica TaxID=709868 RepID=UPI002E0F3E62|nr:hypothetical protein OHB55_31825 [Micromonospora ureilytica]
MVDDTAGDAPNLRMPVRMLLVDTPEVTARSAQRAAGSVIDQEVAQLAEWIRHATPRHGTARLAAPFVIYPSVPDAANTPEASPLARSAAAGGLSGWRRIVNIGSTCIVRASVA